MGETVLVAEVAEFNDHVGAQRMVTAAYAARFRRAVRDEPGAERHASAHSGGARRADGAPIPVYLQRTASISSEAVLQRQPRPGVSLLDEPLTLDPEIEAEILRIRLQRILDPAAIERALLQLALDPTLLRPEIFALPALPEREPIVTPGAGPARPAPAEIGHLVRALLRVGPVDRLASQLQERAAERARRDWAGLATGERAAVVSSAVVLGAGALGGILSDPEASRFVLGQLNGRVLPVPWIPGLGFEVNTQRDNLMFGLHLDVGRLLPETLGFGAGAPSAIGAPPVRRKALPGEPAIGHLSQGDRQPHEAAAGLRVSKPGEPEEIEADRVADQITGAGAGAGRPLLSQPGLGSQPTHLRGPAVAGQARLESLERGGAPLPRFLRAVFERRLGSALGAVRVHNGADAAQLASAVNARAFTLGHAIVFNAGEFAPQTAAGRRLLAHELVHVVQQNGRSPLGTPPAVEEAGAVH